MKWGIRPSVQSNVPFIVYAATRGKKKQKQKNKRKRKQKQIQKQKTGGSLATYSYCDNGAKIPLMSAPGRATVWGGVCCTPDLSSYYLHGYDIRVREWCESQWGHAGAGHGWSPGGVYRAPRCENEFLHSTVLLHPLSQVNVKRVQAIVPCVILCVCLCCLKLILRNRSGETDPGVGAL